MPDFGLLTRMGAPTKATRWVPLTTKRWFTGLWTQRNPFLSPGTRNEELATGGRSDALIDGLNVEISNSNTLIRRPGFIPYSSATLPQAPNSFYSWQKNDSSIRVLADTNAAVYSLTTTTANPVLWKDPTAGNTTFVNVGNTLFLGNGVEQKKWNGGVNLLQYSEDLSNTVWTKQSNVTISTNSTTDPNGGNTADTLTTGASAGVGVLQTTKSTALAGSTTATFSVWLKTASGTQQVIIGVNSSTAGNQQSNTVTATTTWTRFTVIHNATWTGNVPIGCLIQLVSASASVYVWGCQLELGSAATTYESVGARPGGPVTKWGIDAPTTAPTWTTQAGSLSPTKGYSYVYCFKNSITQHVSTASPVSANTGALTSKQINLQGNASTDPQVDTIQIFRITDGGGQAGYLFLAEIPNPGSGTWTYADNNADTVLNTAIIAPQAKANEPPPTGLTNIAFWANCVWGSVGNLVYYSNSQFTTVGSGYESFPPLNFFGFKSRVVALVPWAKGLLVVCVDGIHIIEGIDKTNFTSSSFYDGVGLLSNNAYDVNANTVYMFTQDRQFIAITPEGVLQLGFPNGDEFAQINPANVYVTSHSSGHNDSAVYISDGSTTIWRCNPQQFPDGGPCWSPKAVIAGGVKATYSVEITPGVKKLFAGGTGAGSVLMRDLNTYTDNGTTYSAFATIGSMVLAQPGQLAEVQSITTELKNVGTQPKVGVLLNEISGTFQDLPNYVADPPSLPPSSSVMSNRFYMCQGQLPVVLRHMQIKITFAAENARNEMLSLTLFGALHIEA